MRRDRHTVTCPLSTFSWWDFPHYVLGCILGWLWLRQLQEIGYAKKS